MFDERETIDPQQREMQLFADFSNRLEACVSACPGLAAHLQSASLQNISDRDTLARLPVLRKSELMKAQQANPPFGGFVRESALNGSRMFMSPGPVWEPQLAMADPWQSARALHAAGFKASDRVHNAFSYHLTPGGFILDEGARALGCIVFPAGVGNTENQVLAIQQLQPVAYVGTPDYLQTLLDHANTNKQAINSIKRAMVSGGALFPSMRERYSEQGIQVQQCYATADLGVIAYESSSDGVVHPGMIVNEDLIVEILVPGTSTPVMPGETGEVVVTRLHPDYPLLRFATGDLSALISEQSPCGRTGNRLKGWLGRADQRVKVRGMFIDPVQFASIQSMHPEILRWRVTVSRQGASDVMKLQVTATDNAMGQNTESQWLEALSATLKKLTGISGEVELVASLPADGIVIDDIREYDTGS